jgi:hypothetical protein
MPFHYIIIRIIISFILLLHFPYFISLPRRHIALRHCHFDTPSIASHCTPLHGGGGWGAISGFAAVSACANGRKKVVAAAARSMMRGAQRGERQRPRQHATAYSLHSAQRKRSENSEKRWRGAAREQRGSAKAAGGECAAPAEPRRRQDEMLFLPCRKRRSSAVKSAVRC